MDSFTKILDLMQTLDKYLTSARVYVLFFLSSASFFVLEFFSRYIILNAMINTIKELLFYIAIFSGVAVVYKIFEFFLMKLCEPHIKKKKEEEERSATQERILKSVNGAVDYLLTLSNDEKALLKYFHNNSVSAVYIPFDNPVALALWNKGVLKRIADIVFTRYPDKKKVTGTCCFLYHLTPELNSVIKVGYKRLGFEQIVDKFDFSEYQ